MNLPPFRFRVINGSHADIRQCPPFADEQTFTRYGRMPATCHPPTIIKKTSLC